MEPFFLCHLSLQRSPLFLFNRLEVEPVSAVLQIPSIAGDSPGFVIYLLICLPRRRRPADDVTFHFLTKEEITSFVHEGV
ncbi:hypothetical protein HanIR_Chr01g0041591 [Helianthus annuus]|nr:hypothetical protein HanIR_Chr01g0041591 [Helianthus annuus]